MMRTVGQNLESVPIDYSNEDHLACLERYPPRKVAECRFNKKFHHYNASRKDILPKFFTGYVKKIGEDRDYCCISKLL